MEPERAAACCPRRGLLADRLVPAVTHWLGEECAVPHRLDDQEDGIEQHGDDGEQQRLVGRVDRIGRRRGVVRYDQGEHGKRGDDHEEGLRAGEIVFLLPITQRAHQQRRAHHAVQHDHQRGEHGIARERGIVRAVQHDRGEQRDLDGDHREGQHESAVRLAEPLGHGLGVAHHGEGAPHHGAEQPSKQQDGDRVIVEIGEEGVLVEVSDKNADEPRYGGASDSEQGAQIERRRRGGRLEGLALVHVAPVYPRPATL